MAFCTNCGSKLGDDFLFCPECGTRIAVPSPPVQTGQKKLCAKCGALMDDDLFYCLNCGEMLASSRSAEDPKRIVYRQPGLWRNKWVSLLLCIFFGWFGAHKYYESKVIQGVIYSLTLGLFGFGWIIDTIILACKPNPYLAKAEKRGS